MKENRSIKLVQSAVVFALVFTTTWFVVPSPILGNINLGDSMILVGSLVLGGPWAVVACALAAALCDFAAGYAMYVPATLIFKASMVLVKLLFKKASQKPLVTLLSAVCAELVMVAGYLVYEALILGYGFAAVLNIPFNLIQGALNIVLALLICTLLKKIGVLKKEDS